MSVYAVWINNLDTRLPRIGLFANRDIHRQEELTFDYKMTGNHHPILPHPNVSLALVALFPVSSGHLSMISAIDTWNNSLTTPGTLNVTSPPVSARWAKLPVLTTSIWFLSRFGNFSVISGDTSEAKSEMRTPVKMSPFKPCVPSPSSRCSFESIGEVAINAQLDFYWSSWRLGHHV